MRVSKRVMSLGTESAFEVLAQVEQLEKQGRNVINLSIGQPDFKTSENIVEAAVKALRDGMHGYTPAPGIEALREAVSQKYLSDHEISLDPNNVLITPGGKPVIFFAVFMFGHDDGEILYPDPGFPIYESVINFSGARAVPYALSEKKDFSITADAILNRITPKTKLLILNSPHNPTGSVSSKKEIEKLIAGLLHYPNIGILSDEIYSKIHFDNLMPNSMIQFPEIRERTIILDGWSKSYAMTGWRLGYSIWPKNLIEKAIRFAINTHSCVNGFVQMAGVEALNGSQDDLKNMITIFRKRRDVIVSGLNSIRNISCVNPKGAFYVFPNIKETGKNSLTLQNDLLNQEGVALLAGSSFGSNGEGYLRLSYANSMENIEIALDRMKNYFENPSKK